MDKNETVLSENNEKRASFIKWDEYFMAMTLLESTRRTKKSFKNAAIILNSRKIIISIGCESLSDKNINSVDQYYNHAEYEALQKIDHDSGDVMYTTSFPCEKCANFIVQKRISEVVYLNSDNDKAKDILDQNNVCYRKFISERKKIELDFSQFCDDC